MKCDLCGREFNNSDELKEHKEEVHPMDKGEVPDMDKENPEVKRKMPEPVEMPETEAVQMPGHRTS